MRRVVLQVLGLLCAVSAWADSTSATPKGTQRMEIVVEKMDQGEWKAVEPNMIFSSDDHIRFRFRANFAGYLYVMNQSTSGNYTQLFPREDTGQQNRISASREYMVPANEGSFRVAGPAGHDVLYWMVSPIEIGGTSGRTTSARMTVPPLPTEKPAAPPVQMTPRCDDALFRARGECLDSSAGPKGLSKPSELPSNLSGVSQQPPDRELYFIRDKQAAVVSSPKPLSGPVIYEFHLAHK